MSLAHVIVMTFQSTLPMRGATNYLCSNLVHVEISIHTPHAGSDTAVAAARVETIYFNPHSPCGERPMLTIPTITSFSISIHTPHAGSDSAHGRLDLDHDLISIHTPHAGSDLRGTRGDVVQHTFQSTLPMRGATPEQHCLLARLVISIHTPHAGSDRAARYKKEDYSIFQSTLPMRGATQRDFSLWLPNSSISIHTPHAGSDPLVGNCRGRMTEFQSTLPMRGATSQCNLSTR